MPGDKGALVIESSDRWYKKLGYKKLEINEMSEGCREITFLTLYMDREK